MRRCPLSVAAYLAIVLGLVLGAAAQDTPAGPDRDAPPVSDGTTYTLRYKFEPGETIRWQTEHNARMKTTVGGVTQSTESVSLSVKVWKVTGVDDQGQATFINSVESVDMRQKLTGRKEVRYNSETDKKPPQGFEDAANNVNVPLTEVTLDAMGNLINRTDIRPRTAGTLRGHVAIPLPAEPVQVGHQWFLPDEVQVKTDRVVRKIKIRQRFTLKAVDDNVATIGIETQVLSPIDDPAIEVQLVQTESNGEVRLDLEAGRVVRQSSEVTKNVVGFEGDASVLDYYTQFTEILLSSTPATASAK